MPQYYTVRGYDYLTNIFNKGLVFLEGSNILGNVIALQPNENHWIYRIDSDSNINKYKYDVKDGKVYLVGKIFIPTFYYMNSVTDYFGIKGEHSIFSSTCNKYKINA